MSSSLDRPGRPPWLTARHLRSCRECRELWAGLNRVHQGLLEDGRKLRQGEVRAEPEPSWSATVRPQTSRPDSGRRFAWSWRPLAGLAAALLLLVTGLRFLPLKPPPETTPMPKLIEDTRGRLALLLEARNGRTLESPLEDELHGMIASARLAAEFLAKKAEKTRRLLADQADTENDIY